MDELVLLPEYRNKQYGDALKKCFVRMDTLMQEPEGQARLKQIQEQFTTPDPFAGGAPLGEGDNIAQFIGCTATVVLINQ